MPESREDALTTFCREQGLPEDAPLDRILDHVRGNAALTAAFNAHCEALQDERTFAIDCHSTVTGADPHDSMIEVRASGVPKTPAPIGHFIENLVQMLWNDAFAGGPWRPSFIDSVTITQQGGNVMTYSRHADPKPTLEPIDD